MLSRGQALFSREKIISAKNIRDNLLRINIPDSAGGKRCLMGNEL